jgi:acyltransferase
MASAHFGRTQWIDSAKGVGILLIFFGHIYSTVTPSALYIYIYAFHVPLFFFLSGVVLKPGREPMGDVVTKKLRTLIVPYLWYSLLGYLFYLAGYFYAQHKGLRIEQFEYGLWPPLAGIFYGTIGDGRLINGPLWFVLALFWTFLIGYAINTFIRQPALQWASVLLVAGTGLWLAGRVTLPFSGVAALSALVFFQAGYRFQAGGWSHTLGARQQWLLFIGLFAVSLFSQVNGFVAFGEGLIGQPLWFLLFAFAGLFWVLMLLIRLEGRTRWLAFVGRYSLSIMLIHMLIIKAVKVLLAAALGTTLHIIDNDVGLGLLVLAVSAVLLVPAVAVMERYLPFTLGKSAAAQRPAVAQS